MKKILVVLLILAVAGGVFAQDGSWSIGGQVDIGSRINFDPQPDIDQNDPAIIDGIAYHNYQKIQGVVDLNYSKEGLGVGLEYDTSGAASIDAAFTGENYRGQVAIEDVLKLLVNGGGMKPSRLWGEYKFLNGMVTLVGAFNSADTQYWVSDLTGSYKDDPNYNGSYGADTKWDRWEHMGAEPFSHGGSFTKVDHHNYFLTNVEVAALSFGIMIPNTFPFRGATDTWGGPRGNTKFIEDSLRHTKLGLSFANSPFEIAAQFYFENYGIYFGGKFFTGPITIGLSFMGELDGDGKPYTLPDGSKTLADADPMRIKIGGTVQYGGSGFGGGLQAFYDRNGMPYSGTDNYLTTIGVEPSFYYDAIPSHLRFKLGAGMYFLDLTNGTESSKETVWALQPELFWNFKGTGAGDNYYWPLDTAIFVRYRLAGVDVRNTWGDDAIGSVNFLDVVFKWSF